MLHFVNGAHGLHNVWLCNVWHVTHFVTMLQLLWHVIMLPCDNGTCYHFTIFNVTVWQCDTLYHVISHHMAKDMAQDSNKTL